MVTKGSRTLIDQILLGKDRLSGIKIPSKTKTNQSSRNEMIIGTHFWDYILCFGCNISNTVSRVSPHFQTLRRELKPRRVAEHF